MKQKSVYVCQNCGYQSPKWTGQCPECNEWNTLSEEIVDSKKDAKKEAVNKRLSARADFESLYDVATKPQKKNIRITTGIGEFDHVLGSTVFDSGEVGSRVVSGLVPGSVSLIAGEPGIGKSTLVTQTIMNILMNQRDVVRNEGLNEPGDKGALDEKSGSDLESHSMGQKKILYVNGEENASQIAERIDRVYKKCSEKMSQTDEVETRVKTRISRREKSEVKSDEYEVPSNKAWMKNLIFVDTTNVDEVCSIIEQLNPYLVVVDSIQTLKTEDLTGTAGSFGQLKESTSRVTEISKKLSVPTLLIGHVNKEGSIAGPKVLEHIVDGVFELSGERTGEVRVLRAIKNRFGATDEVGLFLIDEDGLKELTNPSEIFLQANDQVVPGSAIVCTLEGTRPLLLETQALVVESQLAIPRRIAQGISIARLQVLTAVLQKHARLGIGSADVFVNVAGGFQIREPAADLGVALAIVSSLKNQAMPRDTICIGEVGLLGEIREVPFLKRRIKEAKRLGYSKIISSNTHKNIRAVIGELFKKGE